MKTQLLVLLLCFCATQFLFAQEDDGVVSLNLPIRNSLAFNRYAINPTFSFVREQNKYISLYNKREWVQFDDAPLTYLASYTGRFTENIGAGIGVFQQNYGVLSTFGGVLNFAYNARLTSENNLTFGLNVGAYKSGINTGRVISNFDDPSLQNVPENFLLTINPGINFGLEFLDFGLSVNNLVAYNFKTSSLVDDNPERGIQTHIMYTGYMNSSGFFDDSKFSGLIKSEFKKDETVVSAIAMLTVPKGIWAQAGYNSLYGISAGIGLNITPQIAIEYNIEKGIGAFTNFGNVYSHDITLAYRFKNNKNYYNSTDEEAIGLLSPGTKSKTSTSKISKAEADANREQAAARKAQAEAEAQAKLLAEQKAKEEADAQARLLAEQKSKDEADAQARLLAEQKAKEEADAQARLIAEQKAKEEADAQARLLAEQKAKEEADAQARLLAEQKAKEEADAQARRLAEQKAKEEADAQARRLAEAKLLAEQKAKEEAEEQARLLAEQEAREKAEAEAKLLAEQEAIAEAEAQARILAEQEAKAEVDAQAKRLAEQKEKEELITNPKDALGKAMFTLSEQTEASKTRQDELFKKIDDVVAIKDQDLRDLKEENDLSEQGIIAEPKPFKNTTDENNSLKVMISDLDNVIKTRNEEIESLKNLYDDNYEASTINLDEVNLFYRKTIDRITAEQQDAEQAKLRIESKLEAIQIATEFERNRRIKRAAFDNEQERYSNDRAALQNIKRITPLREQPYKTEDFDFGEKQSNNIQILKNIDNVESGYYMIIAVHSDIEKRNEFVTKVVASGRRSVDFFYDVKSSKYFIYYEKFDGINTASEALKTKGNRPYNTNMSLVKIEN